WVRSRDGIAPEVRPLIHGDMAEQRSKLMKVLGVVVNGLKKLDAVPPSARALAVRQSTIASRRGTTRRRRGADRDRRSRPWAGLHRRGSQRLARRLWRAFERDDRRGLWGAGRSVRDERGRREQIPFPSN